MEEIPSINKKYRKHVENEDDETEEGDEGREVKKRKKLTDKEKGMIEGLDRAGWTERDIAEEVKCSQSTVHYWKTVDSQNPEIQEKAESGKMRLPMLTPRAKRHLKIRILKDDEPSTRTLAAEWKHDPNLPTISKDTVYRSLHEQMPEARAKTPKPSLTRKADEKPPAVGEGSSTLDR